MVERIEVVEEKEDWFYHSNFRVSGNSYSPPVVLKGTDDRTVGFES